MPDDSAEQGVAIALLAGGEARRFPRKLERLVEGEPMIVRCFHAMRATHWPVYVCARERFSRELELLLEAPLLIDPEPGRGPLAAFLSACEAITAERIFAIAADQPRLDASVLHALLGALRAGDEAVVPRHADGIEPLAALYDRRAVLREADALRTKRSGAMHDLVERLNARFLPMDARHFYNVNWPSDLAELAAGR